MTDINSDGWSVTDASNNAPAPAGWPEGMMPSGVNDSARGMMGAIKRWHNRIQPTIVATGSADTIFLTYPVAPAGLIVGDQFTFFSKATNLGPATLDINGLGAHPIVIMGGEQGLVGGEIRANTVVTVHWDGMSFRMYDRPAQNLVAPLGRQMLPGGLQMVWGHVNMVATNAQVIPFSPFDLGILFGVQVTLMLLPNSQLSYGISSAGPSGFQLNLSSTANCQAYWLAYGI